MYIIAKGLKGFYSFSFFFFTSEKQRNSRYFCTNLILERSWQQPILSRTSQPRGRKKKRYNRRGEKKARVRNVTRLRLMRTSHDRDFWTVSISGNYSRRSMIFDRSDESPLFLLPLSCGSDARFDGSLWLPLSGLLEREKEKKRKKEPATPVA